MVSPLENGFDSRANYIFRLILQDSQTEASIGYRAFDFFL